MPEPKIIVFGLGSGDGDDLTLGTVRRLKELSSSDSPIFLRTERHPSVAALSELGIKFDESFDNIYDSADTFADVYQEIRDRVVRAAKRHGFVAYAVPGHPLLGEKTVRLLLENSDEIAVELVTSTSFIDSCLISARVETTGLIVLDALSLPDSSDAFRFKPQPFIKHLTNLVYQVYDRHIASTTKLALLETYSPEIKVAVIDGGAKGNESSVIYTPLFELDHAKHTFNHLTSVLIPPIVCDESNDTFANLLDIMARLRNPVTGCPWDREQTPQSLKRYAIEEVYELIDAIDEGDVNHYVEELGDLLLQVAFHTQLAREAGEFTVEDVVTSVVDKLVRRHPHVFGSLSVEDSAEVLVNWEAIKKTEKGNAHRISRLDGVPNHLPALSRALEVSKRAAKAGFEWEAVDGVFAKVEEELAEYKEALASGDAQQISSELGDLLFTVVNLGRFSKTDAEDALRQMVSRFINRFKQMESMALGPMENLSPTEFERLWQAAKWEEIRGRLDIKK